MKDIIGLDEVRYLRVDAGVRYYEDATVNGEDDVDMYENYKVEGAFPKMPCVEQINDYPTDVIHTDHLRWRPIIDIKEGVITNWRKGTRAHAFYKVCDNGVYTLLDENNNALYVVESYVPSILSIDDKGYGDYIDMVIDENGKINHWKCDYEDLTKLLRNSFGWCEDDED